MGWYRSSSRFIFDYFRRHNSRDCCRQKSHSGISSSKPNFTGKFSQPIFRNTTALQSRLKQSQWGGSVLIGAKRYYCVDRNRVHHFKRAEILIKLVMVVVVSSGVVIKLYFWNLETVPYTKRAHYVPLLISREKEIGDYHFKLLKSQFKGKILPPLHPQSIRVLRISQDIIGALQKGLMKKKEQQVWRISYSSESVMLDHETMTHSMGDQWKLGGEDKWHKDEEILDDKWVQQSRKRGEDKGKKSHTAHLEGLNWEVCLSSVCLVERLLFLLECFNIVDLMLNLQQ